MNVPSDSDEESYNNVIRKLEKLKEKSLAENEFSGCIDSADNYIDLTGVCSNTVKDNIIPNNSQPSALFLNEPIIVSDGRRSDSGSDIDVSPSKNRKRATSNRKRNVGSTVRTRRSNERQSFGLHDEPPSDNRRRGSSKRSTNTRSRVRGTGRSKNAYIDDDDDDFLIRNLVNPEPPARRRGKGRCRQSPRLSNCPIPTYSVGNTDEYPDALENQKMFSQKPIDIPTIDLESSFLNNSMDNEELSVKVFWQSLEVVKFNIRRLQKLTEIFDFFANRDGVCKDNLLFTYNNNFLKPDDTPESICYNITKFIDGGIINNKVSKPPDQAAKLSSSGFTVKFQFQIQKQPYKVNVGKDDKLNLAMIRCAEHLEVPIARLRFEFDGDIVQGHQTPNNLDMESGDCIDVIVLS